MNAKRPHWGATSARHVLQGARLFPAIKISKSTEGVLYTHQKERGGGGDGKEAGERGELENIEVVSRHGKKKVPQTGMDRGVMTRAKAS